MVDSADVTDSVVLVAWDAVNDQVMVDLTSRSLPRLRVAEAAFGAAVPDAARSELTISGPLLDHVATVPDIFVISAAAVPRSDGLTWVPGDAAAVLVDFPPAREWLRQRHHPLRPWFSPAWHDEAVGYASDVLDALEVRLLGSPVQVRHWPLSSVLRLATTAGTYYLKTIPSADVCEPCLLAMLRDQDVPNLPPAPVAHDHDHHRWVSAELSGTDGWSLDEEHRVPAIRALAELQQATMAHLDRLETFGITPVSLDSLPILTTEVIGREDLWNTQAAPFERWRGLTPAQHRAWLSAAPWLIECSERLAELADRTGIHTSLTHGDYRGHYALELASR